MKKQPELLADAAERTYYEISCEGCKFEKECTAELSQTCHKLHFRSFRAGAEWAMDRLRKIPLDRVIDEVVDDKKRCSSISE